MIQRGTTKLSPTSFGGIGRYIKAPIGNSATSEFAETHKAQRLIVRFEYQ